MEERGRKGSGLGQQIKAWEGGSDRRKKRVKEGGILRRNCQGKDITEPFYTTNINFQNY